MRLFYPGKGLGIPVGFAHGWLGAIDHDSGFRASCGKGTSK